MELGWQSYSGDWRLKTVSGKGFGSENQIFVTSARPRSLELPPTVAWSSQVAAKPWGFNDPEMKRRKRITRYKIYTVEGRVNASIRNGFRWIKNKCSELIHGY